MKKFLWIAAISVSIGAAACGGNSGSSNTSTDSSTNTTVSNPNADSVPANISSNPDYKKGLQLIASNDCLTCHQISGTSTGPAYQDVANKYSNDSSVVNALAQKVIHGGSGVWGTVPMVAHPDLPTDDAKAMVKYILLLKTKK